MYVKGILSAKIILWYLQNTLAKIGIGIFLRKYSIVHNPL